MYQIIWAISLKGYVKKQILNYETFVFENKTVGQICAFRF